MTRVVLAPDDANRRPGLCHRRAAAKAARPLAIGKTIEGAVDAYLDSQDFATKRDRTRGRLSSMQPGAITESCD
jgi:hypothetical protein